MSVDQLIAHYKTQTRAAEALDVTQSAVSNWVSRGFIPPKQQLRAQIKSRGKLKADKGIV